MVRPRADSNVYTTTALLANNRVTVRVYDKNTAADPAGCSADSDANQYFNYSSTDLNCNLNALEAMRFVREKQLPSSLMPLYLG